MRDLEGGVAGRINTGSACVGREDKTVMARIANENESVFSMLFNQVA